MATRPSVQTRTKTTEGPVQDPLAEAPVANLPTIIDARIPYHPLLAERFGVDKSAWRALVDAIFPNAKSIESVLLALSYCKARGLDVFKRPCHIVSVWNSEQRRYIDSIWSGIGELRTTASRTGSYAGFDECLFGQDNEQTFDGNVGKEGNERHIKATVRYPEWAQITVYRLVQNQRVAFPGPKVFWLETYATIGKSDVPNDMWQTRPYGQLEKCAEAAALRRAFPEEIGDDHIQDEVGRVFKDVTPPAPTETRPTRAEAASGPSARPGEPAKAIEPNPDQQFKQVVNGTIPDLLPSDPDFDEVHEAVPEPDRTTPQGHMPPIPENMKRPATPPSASPPLAAEAPQEADAPYTITPRRKGKSYDWDSFATVLLDKLTYARTIDELNEWVKVNNGILGPWHREDPKGYGEFGSRIVDLQYRKFGVALPHVR